ncbi:MAG TPA: hypothetical protein VE998_02065, partial [Terriglobales bacterium]|nr:hypothetical protein [Terriglobales bacterium]
LTLNLGLRWEWDQQAINLLHDISVQNVAQGIWTGPTNVTEIPALPQQLHQFEPNFGFAYTPKIAQRFFGDGKTVIRGGYRIAYDPSFYNIFLNVATSAPVVNLGSFNNQALISNPIASAVDSAYFSQIPEGGNPGSRNQTRVSSDFHQPMVQQWSFGFERQIAGRMGFESRYVGNHATGQFETIDGNPLLTSIPSQDIPSGVTPCTTAGAAGLGRPDCNFGNLRVRNNGAFSRYNGWQNQLTVRDYHNLTATVGYTFSKTIDSVSEIFAATGGGISNPAPENPFDPTVREKGLSAQNFPHIFNVTWVYSIPFLRDQQGLIGHIFGGWQWAGDYEFQSGTPVGLFQNVTNPACDVSWNNAFVGTDSCRPIISNASAPINTVGRYTSASSLVDNSTGLPTTPGAVHWLVNNAFADAAVCNGDPFACTVGRNTIVGMARNNMDLSMQKNFKVTERFTFQARIDALNALNYQYRGAPGVNVNSRNVNGVSGNTLAPGSFMDNLLNSNSSPGASGTSVRALILSGHIYF